MALYDITKVNGITRVETAIGHVYHFPLEVIRTDTNDASMTRTPAGESDSEYVRFSSIENDLGAGNIEGYVDALCMSGYYSGFDTSLSDNTKQEGQKTRVTLNTIAELLMDIRFLLQKLNE